MDKLKVVIEFAVSLEGFTSKEEAIKYYNEYTYSLFEALEYADDTKITFDNSVVTEGPG
jgi:hypothetical protein